MLLAVASYKISATYSYYYMHNILCYAKLDWPKNAFLFYNTIVQSSPYTGWFNIYVAVILLYKY